MKRFSNYADAEHYLLVHVCYRPDFITKTTFEVLHTGFTLIDPFNNQNDRSNYQYAQTFFEWMLTGERSLSEELFNLNPWVKRFVDTTGLPENFSTSYGWKIKAQLNGVYEELSKDRDSRKAYINILIPADKRVLNVKTTHEYPCTIGLQFFIRDELLHLMVNMRSNNIYSVMPYDVFLFTSLLIHVAEQLKMSVGYYHHQINSAHVYKGDVRRLKESHLKQT